MGTLEFCELLRLDDPERLYGVKLALEARGIEADVWREGWGDWLSGRALGTLRLMVLRRDLVYARWVAYAAGLDAWPDEASADEGGDTSARPAEQRREAA